MDKEEVVKEDGMEEEVKEEEVVKEKKVVKPKTDLIIEFVATETAEQIKDSSGNIISDRELLVKIYNDVQKLKRTLVG